MNHFIPPDEYFKAIPRKYMGAGVIFIDELHRVLIVKTTYKETWEVPGGSVDKDESLLDSAVRELKEELNLNIDRSQLQLVTTDYRHPGEGRPESIQFHFWGGVIDPVLITVDNDEITEYKFVDPSELGNYCSARLAQRTRETVKAALAGRTVYLEDGYPIQ